MSSNRSSSGGVRNLRAMFENGGGGSDSTAPLERGRSPAGSEGAPRSGANTPRPLSKVRTSFVAIERSGQIGLQLGVTKEKDDEAAAAAPEAADKPKQTNGLGEIKEVEVLKKLPEASNGNLVKAAPEKPVSANVLPPEEKTKTDTGPQTTTSAVKSAKSTKAPASISAPDKPAAVDTKPPPKSGEQSRPPKPASSASANPVKPAEKVEAPKAKSTTTGPKAKPQASVSKSDKDHPTPESSTRRTVSKPLAEPQESSSSSAPAPIATSKGPAKGTQPNNAPKPVTKTPTSAKATAEMAPPPRAPNTNSDYKEKTPAPTADSTKPSTSSKPEGATPAKARSKDAPTKEVKRPKEISLETGPFVKPKPKSPTRPVQLPASATAPTAAWAAKIAPEKLKGISRSPSRSKDAPPKEVKRPKEISLETGPFVKPKPKSPTRPVQLPASATAPTAAWAAKIAPEEPKGISRSPSRSTATKTLRRQPSKVNADRPALGRPRESAASDLRRQSSRQSLPAHRLPHQPSRPSIAGAGAGAGAGTSASGVDDGFLARMMRPTASSASKTHDKPSELKPATTTTTTTTLKPRVAKTKSGSFGSEAARSDRSASASVQESAAVPMQAVHKDVPLPSIETDGGTAATAETEAEVEIKVESEEAGDGLEGVPLVEEPAAEEPAGEAVSG